MPCTLFDAVLLQRGFDLPASKRRAGPFPVVASTSRVGFHDEAKVKGPGVVIGRSGSIGGGQWIETDFWPLNTTLWVKDFRGNEPKYIYYLMKSIDYSHLNAGSGVPTLNRNHLTSVSILLPPLPVQRRIAAVLGTLDDLIATNERLQGCLDQELAAISRGLSDRMRSKERVGLAEHAEITRGYSYRSTELHPGRGWLVTLKNFGRDGSFQDRGFKEFNGEARPGQYVSHGDLLVSMTDLTQERAVIARPVRVRASGREGPFVASTDLTIVRPVGDMTVEVLQALLGSDDFREHALGYCNGTTVLHMSVQALPSYQVPRLAKQDIDEFTGLARPIWDAASSALDEVRELRQTRDELLPLLMSGRVSPGEVDLRV